MMLELNDLKKLAGQVFVLDVETNGLHWYEHGVIGVAIHAPRIDVSGYLPTCTYQDVADGKPKTSKVWTGDYEINPATGRKRKQWTTQTVQAMRKEAIPDPDQLAPISALLLDAANDPNTCIIAHNAKFDLHMLGLDLFNLPCKLMDTSIMVHLINSNNRKSLAAAEDHFLGGASKRAHLDAAPKGYPKDWPLDVCAAYAINDAVVEWQLAEELTKHLRKLGLVNLFWQQMRFLRAMWQIERKGLLIDAEFSNQAIIALTDRMRDLEAQLQDAAGSDFNWRSHKQLSEAIYDGLGVDKPVIEGNSKAAQKVSDSATSAFALAEANHPLKELILDLREVDKLIKNLLSYLELSQADGAIHTSFNLTGTVTGRLSSSDPNVQNIASQKRKRDSVTAGVTREDEYNTRNAFIARPGYTFIAADHAQQEVRLLAILAQEQNMLAVLNDPTKDLHLQNAITIWGDCGEELNKIHRTWAKSISFALPYGMSEDSMKMNLAASGVPPERVDKVYADYFDAFPGLKPWMEQVTRSIEANGYIRYWSGRIWRTVWPTDAYKGVNAVIQGGCADLVSLAVSRLQAVLQAQGWGSVVSIIHDEIIAEIKDEYIADALPVIAAIMEVPDALGVPFAAECKVGTRYGAMTTVSAPRINVDWGTLIQNGSKINEYAITGYYSVK